MKQFKNVVTFSLISLCLACSNAMAVVDPACDSASQDQIQKVYIAYYGRPGDPPGLNFWCERFIEEGNLDSVIQDFGTAAEFTENYGGLSNDQLIDTIYRQMFGRDPDEAGKAFYSNRLSSNESSLQTITLEILNAASGSDKTVIDERVTAANLFTSGIPSGFDYESDADAWSAVLEESTDLLLLIFANKVTDFVDADVVTYVKAQIENLTRDSNNDNQLDYTELGADADFDSDGIINSEDNYLFDVSNAPLFTSQQSIRVDVVENKVDVAYSPQMQEAKQAPGFSLAGNDSSLFGIDAVTGSLHFLAAPNFEDPKSTSNTNNYVVTVTATDASDNTKTASQDLNISVTNVDESAVPVFASGDSVTMREEQLATGYTAVANAEVNNGSVDFVVYYLRDDLQDSDNALFLIDVESGELTFRDAPDFEDVNHGATYNLTITALAFDSFGFGRETRKDVAVTVENVDMIFDEPVKVVDRKVAGFEGVVHTAIAQAESDFTVDEISYRLVAGGDNKGCDDLSVFDLTATGDLSFKVEPPPVSSCGEENIYSVQIEALADGSATGAIQIVSIEVDLNQIRNDNAPAFASSTATSNAIVDTIVTGYTATATDADDNDLFYSVTGGADIDLFTIDVISGVLSFKEPKAFASGFGEYRVDVTASDGEFEDSQAVTIKIQEIVEFTVSDAHVVEGDTEDTVLGFRVTLDHTYNFAAVLNYETLDNDSTADISSDYDGVSSGVLTIAARDSSGSIFVTVVGDTFDTEGDETVLISVRDSRDGGARDPVISTGTIYDEPKMNDTGITLCGDYAFDGGSGSHDNNITCGSSDNDGDNVPSGQDSSYGRDVSHNDDGDGVAGFSFTKLDSDGQALPYEAEEWSCVQDNTTGLIWEVKSPAGSDSLRDASFKYTWYNTTGINDGGSIGARTGAVCFDVLHCNTEGFPEEVNAEGLCGASDWRTPSREELVGLVSFGRVAPSIDRDWFPNTQLARYWSSSPVSVDSGIAWRLNFSFGYDDTAEKSSKNHIRLVRDAK